MTCQWSTMGKISSLSQSPMLQVAGKEYVCITLTEKRTMHCRIYSSYLKVLYVWKKEQPVQLSRILILKFDKSFSNDSRATTHISLQILTIFYLEFCIPSFAFKSLCTGFNMRRVLQPGLCESQCSFWHFCEQYFGILQADQVKSSSSRKFWLHPVHIPVFSIFFAACFMSTRQLHGIR